MTEILTVDGGEQFLEIVLKKVEELKIGLYLYQVN